VPLHLDNLVDRGDPELGDRFYIDPPVVGGLSDLDILVTHLGQKVVDESLEGIGHHVLEPFPEHLPLGSVECFDPSEEVSGTV
jgi:hypothetical protein